MLRPYEHPPRSILSFVACLSDPACRSATEPYQIYTYAGQYEQLCYNVTAYYETTKKLEELIEENGETRCAPAAVTVGAGGSGDGGGGAGGGSGGGSSGLSCVLLVVVMVPMIGLAAAVASTVGADFHYCTFGRRSFLLFGGATKESTRFFCLNSSRERGIYPTAAEDAQ